MVTNLWFIFASMGLVTGNIRVSLFTNLLVDACEYGYIRISLFINLLVDAREYGYIRIC